MDHAKNRTLLASWLRDETPYDPVVPEESPPETSCDLCIVDSTTVVEHADWLREQKRRAGRGFYPVLLVHSGDERHLSDSTWTLVDEAISTPLGVNVFARRLENLFERRRLASVRQRELAASEDQYRAVFEASNDAIVVVDAEADSVVDSNRRASELLGYTRDELRSLATTTRLFPSDADRYEAFVDGVVDTGRGWTDELVVTTSDGTDVMAEVSASVLDSNGSTRIVASIRDITERRAQQLELERQRDELDELHRINRTLRKTTQAVARASSRRTLERDVCEQLTNSDRYRFAWIGDVDAETNEIVPQTSSGGLSSYLESVTITADDSETGRGPAGTALREGEVSIVHSIQTDPAFEPWRAEAREFGVRAVAGVPLVYDDETFGVLSVYATERHAFDDEEREVLVDLGSTVGHAIHALQAQTEVELFEKAVEHAGHAIYIANDDGHIEYVNSAFEESTGYARDEIVGRHHSVLRAGEDDPAFPADLWETVRAGETWQAETTGRRKDGRRQHVEQTVAPITNSGDGEGHFVAVRMDITDQRRRQQQLQTLHRVLRHNIRNELNVVEGYLDIVDDAIPDDSVADEMDKIRNSTEELLRIGRQARRIERTFVGSSEGTNPQTKRAFSEVLRRRCRSVRAQFPEATVESRIPDYEGSTVDAEFATAVEEILVNAVRHTDRDHPTVECEATVEDGPGAVRMGVVTVRDDGPGIPANEREVLREGRETPLLHGSGLGLWLVNWILREVGGEISIDDNDPRGTVVTLRLPLYNA